MDGHSPQDASHPVFPWLTRPQQRLVALLVVTAQLTVAGWWLVQGGMFGRLVRIDQATRLECPSLVDLNQCDWPELTLFPGIGETMARRIIRDREAHGPFRRLEDLERVRGIGPKKLAQLRPYLICRTRADEPTEKP